MKYTKKYAKKIDYVSPVWMDLKSKTVGGGNIQVVLEGESNIDEAYIEELRSQNPDLRIVPRIYLSTEDKYLIQGLEQQVQVYVDLFLKFLRYFFNNFRKNDIFWFFIEKTIENSDIYWMV